MKIYFAVAALIAISSVDAHKISHKTLNKKSGEEAASLDDDLQNLMDKYENSDKKPEAKTEKKTQKPKSP